VSSNHNQGISVSLSLPFAPSLPWLAPRAGWSEWPLRLLCREYGAAVCCTEMISAKGLICERRTGNQATRALLAGAPDDAPLVVQLFGGDPACMGEAVRLLADEGRTYFDCNMGCSVPKVTRAGAGAALLRDRRQALAVAGAMLEAAAPYGARVGFKLRLGWEDAQSALLLAPELEAVGAAWLTLHPRTAGQGFAGQADWKAVAELVERVRVPVVVSGDLWTAHDGLRCLRETGARAVMYARGALRDPAIFARHRALCVSGASAATPSVVACPEEESPAVLHARIRRHAELARTLSPSHTALLKMRTAVPRYIRHLEGAGRLRRAIIGCRSWEEFDMLVSDFFPENDFQTTRALRSGPC
jgi:tRNA-dihydrouridine synthase B